MSLKFYSFFIFFKKYLTATFYASKLSTGIVKNPWAYPECKSTHITLSAPIASINLAISAAEIGTLGVIFPKIKTLYYPIWHNHNKGSEH
jgi:hypothetical protein